MSMFIQMTFSDRSVSKAVWKDTRFVIVLYKAICHIQEEYIMLRLRLSEGLNFAEYEEKFGGKIFQDKINIIKKYEKNKITSI